MRPIVAVLALFPLVNAGELHDAARVCNQDRMRQILVRHPSLNERDDNGMTPLHVAIDSRQAACVRLLLEAGADPTLRDRQGRTAFDAARNVPDLQDAKAMQDWKAIMALLWKSRQQKAGGPETAMPWSLEYTARRGQADVTRMLLALGADPNTTGSGGTTPLADAAFRGDLASVRLLLAHGARIDAVSKAGTQAIHDAALGDSADVIRELASHGANINARTRDEAQTPLHVAAAMGKMKAVEALVGLGADLAAKDARGRTPLDVADRAGMTDVVTFLAKHSLPAK